MLVRFPHTLNLILTGWVWVSVELESDPIRPALNPSTFPSHGLRSTFPSPATVLPDFGMQTTLGCVRSVTF